MKNVDYKELKRLNNLPKYDLGSPIDKGYQASSNPALYGEGYTRNAAPVTNAFVPQAISNAVQNVATPLSNMALGFVKYNTAYNNFIKNAGQETANQYARRFAGTALDVSTPEMAGTANTIASEMGRTVGEQAAKSGAKSAASKALGAANIAMNAYGAIHGGIDLANTLNTKGLDAGELSLGGARYIDPLTGKELWGGLDYAGIDKYSNDLKKSAGISGASAGFESGAGIGGLIGSIFPGAGTLIGSGIGGVLGAIGGFFGGLGAGRKAKRRTEEAKNAYNSAALAHNLQVESKGISEQMRINADLGWNGGKANARVGALETKVHYNNGKPTKAHTYKIVPGKHDWRGDDYYDHLTDNDAIVGNLPDPLTGIPLSFEALPYSQMLLKGNKKLKEYASMALDEILRLQKVAQNIDNEDMKFRADKGRSLRKYNYGTPYFTDDDEFLAKNSKLPEVVVRPEMPTHSGLFFPTKSKKPSMSSLSKGINLNNYEGAWIPATNYLMNLADNYARKRAAEKDPIYVAEPASVPNTQLSAIQKLMPLSVNKLPAYNELNRAFKGALYNINQKGMNPGAKWAMESALYSNYMKNRSQIASDKINEENELAAKYAQLLGSLGESAAQRLQAAIFKHDDNLRQAFAQKRSLLDTIARDKRADLNSLAENLNNIIWGNKNIGLWHDNQKLERDKLSAQYSNTPTTSKSTGVIRLPWTYAPIKQNIPYSTPSWDQVFRNLKIS